jgi:hypothetical protein
MILMKLGDEYKLYSHDSCIATTHESPYKKLSLKNCQAIELGYDLEELAVLSTKEETTIVGNQKMAQGFIKGFKKALEILGDKKFSEEDIKKMMKSASYGWFESDFDKHLATLQQNEWNVEIVMEKEVGTKLHDDGREFFWTDGIKPKLDADGCLILKIK